MTDPLSRDQRMLREIYRYLDRQTLLKNNPDYTEDELVSLFRRVNEKLIAPAKKARAVKPSALPEGGMLGTDGRAILFTDGGSRGNPGPAAYGFVIADTEGRLIAEKGARIGSATNNEAEYAGLIAGIQEALSLGVRDLQIKADSLLVVKQINGEFKIKKAHLKPLCIKAQSLLRQFSAWSIGHIPREENARADALANEAMDRAGNG